MVSIQKGQQRTHSALVLASQEELKNIKLGSRGTIENLSITQFLFLSLPLLSPFPRKWEKGEELARG